MSDDEIEVWYEPVGQIVVKTPLGVFRRKISDPLLFSERHIVDVMRAAMSWSIRRATMTTRKQSLEHYREVLSQVINHAATHDDSQRIRRDLWNWRLDIEKELRRPEYDSEEERS